MRTRPLLERDRPAIRAMLQACGVFSEEEVRVAQELLDEPPAGDGSDYVCFVVEDGEQPCGYVCFGHTPLTRGTWHLYWMCVHPSAQGTGAAQALQACVETFVRSRGGERIVLETSSRADYARARRFYERSGYAVVGHIRGFYRRSDDCITYCKPLVGDEADATVVQPSPGRGRGVFATKSFAAGELIDESPVVVVPSAELEHLDRTVLENYYFVWGDDGAVLLGKMSLCNHAYTPNAAFHCETARQTIRFVALRAIEPGDEITINYNGGPADQSPLGEHYEIPAPGGER